MKELTRKQQDIFKFLLTNQRKFVYPPTLQARHATSRNSGTPVAFIHSPTQRMGDALNALRPPRLRTKPLRQGYLKWLDGYS